MKGCTMRGMLASVVAFFSFGCATEDLRPDFDRARDLVQTTTGMADVRDPEAPVLSEQEILDVLDGGLTLNEALKLALLNSRRLQAGFMGLGVGRADYVQARLLKNPALGLSFLFPSGGGRTRVAGELAQSVMEIWSLPSRRMVAAAGLEQRVLDLSRQAGELIVQTKEAYFERVAAREARAVATEGGDLAFQVLEAVRQRVAAGVARETDVSFAQGLALSAELEAHRSEREEVLAARRLASLLSLDIDLLEVAFTDPLPAPMASLADREVLVEQSRHLRIDLQAMAAAVAVAESRVELERKRALPDLTLGLAAERPESGSSTDLLLGPAATIEIPLFDRNEAQISRAEFARDELQKTYEAMLAEVGQDVRAATDRADLARRAATFVARELLPQSERSVALARRGYELGDSTLLAVLEAQRAALQARLADSDARLEAAMALVDLERKMGRPFAGTPDVPPGEP